MISTTPKLKKIRNQFVFLKRVVRSNFKSEQIRPYKLNFTVSKKCNSRCMNCLNWKLDDKNDLTLEEIRKFAQNAPYFSWINFTGGEPTERKDLAEVVGAFIENCPNLLLVHIPTNGIHTKRIVELAKKLVSMQTPGLVFTVSIDGPPEVNNLLRGIRKDFEFAVETYRQLKKISGLKTMIGMTLYEQNQHLIDETVQAISKKIPGFGYRDIHVNLPHSSSHFYGNDSLNLKATEKMMKHVSDYRKKRGIPRSPLDLIERRYQKLAKKFVSTQKTPMNCSALSASCSLSENGAVYPCTMWGEQVGNIRDTDYQLNLVLDSERKKQLRLQIQQKKCDNCWSPCEAYQTILSNSLKVL